MGDDEPAGRRSAHDFDGHIRALLYVVQFTPDLADAVDHALDQTVRIGALATPTADDWLAHVRAALASPTRLSELLPQPHGEDDVRRFLRAVESQLAGGSSSPG